MSKEAQYNYEIRIPPVRLVALNGGIAGSPCQEILHHAIEKTAKDHDGTLSQSYRDNAGKSHRVLMAVHAPGCRSGIGIRLDSAGRVRFEYDAACTDQATAETVCGEIGQAYAAIALVRALDNLGFSVDATEALAGSAARTVLVSAHRRNGNESVSVVIDRRGHMAADFSGYSGDACSRDEAAMRRQIEAQDIQVVTEQESRKRCTTPLAAWSQRREVSG